MTQQRWRAGIQRTVAQADPGAAYSTQRLTSGRMEPMFNAGEYNRFRAGRYVGPRAAVGLRAGSFEQRSVLVRPGERVTITETSGTQFSGTIASLSSSLLSVNVGGKLRDLQDRDIATIRQRRGDSLANGALWGLGVGATVGIVACGTCHLEPACGWQGYPAGLVPRSAWVSMP